ncbi:MAG: sulfonate transport system permease protein [Thermomicrobiales bacterium]|jgi:sulfonate transport system permease protein|nr:sulfonate transport system permease protein [Thermomicrobiales bacterium]MEA2526863.1 sulfonate transport system permease protein [Thermomicrobiales bacterium]MEA2530296.1 sulfonate transport system permease protein [Thermomicrobiales bacterium]
MNQKLVIRPVGRLASPVSVRLSVPSLRSLRKLIVPAALLLLWQVLAWQGVYSKSQLPPPVSVLKAAQQLWQADELTIHFQASLTRVGQGFVLGSLIAVGIGLAVGLFRWVDELLSPTIQAVRAIPSLAWVPLLILWMGIDERPKITLVAIGVFFPVYTNLVSGIRQIDRKLIEAASAYGYRRLSLAWEVMLPAALPSLFTGLRLGLAQGWLFLVAAELIAASRGLGFLLIDSQNTGRSDIIVMSILFLAVLGKASDWVLQVLERRLLRWSDTYGRTA